MSVPLSMGPMLLMESRQTNSPMYHGAHYMQPGPPLPSNGHIQPNLIQPHHSLHGQAAPSGQHIITSSMNRSQRCGVCRGCQCKPCGQCTYCQDSPQFGGPGVKKQSCIERRCLRVLENRLQRDAPTFKARVGCNQCEDCRMPDCQICLVCLDKRFFDNRYMTGAMCAKKRCNSATSIELPAAQNAELRQAHKRTYDQSGMTDYQIMKRRAHQSLEQLVVTQQRVLNMPTQTVLNGQGCPTAPAATAVYVNQQMRLVSSQSGTPQQLLIVHHHHQQQQQQQQHPGIATVAHCNTKRGAESTVVSTTQGSIPVANPTTLSGATNGTIHVASQSRHVSHPVPQYVQQIQAQHASHSYPIAEVGSGASYIPGYVEERATPQSDPFTPPSYAPEMKTSSYYSRCELLF
ncbi:CXXC zinc finger family protein [Dirofilaria immitis]|nr:CXXC zinc finger family protein [Dirofilaria immitis]